MISRQGLNSLIEDYRIALGSIDNAARSLEAASVAIGGAGQDFTRKSVRLIEQVNDLYTQISRVSQELSEVKTDG